MGTKEYSAFIYKVFITKLSRITYSMNFSSCDFIIVSKLYPSLEGEINFGSSGDIGQHINTF